MTDLRARSRKTADLIIDRLLEKAGFAVIPTVEREHAAGVVAEALAEQIEADARIAESFDYIDYDDDLDPDFAIGRRITSRNVATAIRQAGEKKG